MAKAEQEQAVDEAASGGGKKTIIMFAVVVVVAIAASVFGTMMYLGGTEEPVAQGEAPTDKPMPALYHSLRPSFIINYHTGSKPRLLQADLTVMARDPGVVEALVDHSPLVRSHIVNFLTDQDFFVLQTHAGKEDLRLGLRDMLDDLLREHASVSGVQSVLLTNFVMQ